MRIEDRHRIQNANAKIQLLGKELLDTQAEKEHHLKLLANIQARLDALPGEIETAKRQRDYIVQQVQEGGEERERQLKVKNIDKRLKQLAQKKLQLSRQSQ